MSSDQLFPSSPEPLAEGTFIANEHLYDIVQWLHDSPASVIPGTLSGNAQFGETLSSEDAIASENQLSERVTKAAAAAAAAEPVASTTLTKAAAAAPAEAVASTVLTEHGGITGSTTEERDLCALRTTETTTTEALNNRCETAQSGLEANEIPWNDIQGERKENNKGYSSIKELFPFFISFFFNKNPRDWTEAVMGGEGRGSNA